MKLFEYKIYIALVILFIQSMFNKMCTIRVIDCAFLLNLYDFESQSPLLIYQSGFTIYKPFNLDFSFRITNWEIALAMVFLFCCKFLLDKGLLKLPRKLLVIGSHLPLILMVYSFYLFDNDSLKTLSFGYYYFFLLILISTYTINFYLNNSYVKILLEYKIYILLLILFIQSMFNTVHTKQPAFSTYEVDYLFSKFIHESYIFVFIPFGINFSFEIAYWQITVAMIFLFFFKYLLNQGKIKLPTLLFFLGSYIPFTVMLCGYFSTQFLPFGYYYFFILIAVSTFILSFYLNKANDVQTKPSKVKL